MKMKNTAVLLLFLVVLSLALCGCQSGKNNKSEESNKSYQSSNATTNHNSSIASDDNKYDIYITPGEPYKQGVFTTEEFYSEWMNLYCNIPLGMRLDESYIEVIEKNNQIFSDQGQFREMMATNSDESIRIEVFSLSVEKNGDLEQYVKNHYKSLKDTYKKYSVNGIQISYSADNFSTYSFLGEQYLLNTSKTETRRDGKISRVGNTWDLFRVKGDYIIQIQCYVQKQEKDVELNSDVELEDLLSMFTTYEDHFNLDNTSNDESSNADISTPANSGSENSGVDENNSGGSAPNVSGSVGDDMNGSNAYESNRPDESVAGDNNPSGNIGSANNSSAGSGNSTGGSSGSNTPAAHTHSYADATCTEPKTCTVCGATVGSASGHAWQAVNTTVHHDEEGHYDWVKVADAVYWYHCPRCGDEFTSLDAYYSHFDSAHLDTPFLREEYTHGTMTEDEYEEVWIIDKEAYDEIIVVGYECGKCGATKQ